ncbi:hypothetical protein ACFVIM_01325, partial [Streptomyces sp. NPDC057638]
GLARERPHSAIPWSLKATVAPSPAQGRRLARSHQWIEAVFDTLKGQVGLEQHGGRTPAGVFAHTAQRLLALAAASWHNRTSRCAALLTDGCPGTP